MPYLTILWVIATSRFFATAAKMIGWNRMVGVALSAGTWIVCLRFGWSGFLGQLVLFVGWGVVGMLRERKDDRSQA